MIKSEIKLTETTHSRGLETFEEDRNEIYSCQF